MANKDELINFFKDTIKSIDDQKYKTIISEQLLYFEDDEIPRKIFIFYELMEQYWVTKDYQKYSNLRNIIERYKLILFNDSTPNINDN
jgi:hypothetical protein